MRWYKHDSQDRYSVASKLIRSKWGAEGYGIYQALIEVVAENVGKDRRVWGMVDERYDIDTLAVECATTAERLKEFLMWCDERKIFSKKNNCLYWPEIETRLDKWTETLRSRGEVTGKSLPKNKKENKKEKENVILDGKEADRVAKLKAKAHGLIAKPMGAM